MSDGAEEARFGNAPVRFWWSSGVVLTYKTWTTTSVTGSSNQNGGNLTLHSHNTKWDEIWLSGADGVEWSHTFGGLPLPYHEGQTMNFSSPSPLHRIPACCYWWRTARRSGG